MDAQPIRSPRSGVQVLTTERGLPLRLKLDQRALTQPPQDLAAEILALCRLSAARQQLAHRRQLAEQGHSDQVLRDFNLATADDVAAAEAAFRVDDDEDDGPRGSWMSPV